MIVGVVFVGEPVDVELTTSCTLAVAVVYAVVSVGVKVTFRGSVPAAGTVPAAGEYVYVPGTLAVASSWAELRAVP